jgi:hypothetical protein
MPKCQFIFYTSFIPLSLWKEILNWKHISELNWMLIERVLCEMPPSWTIDYSEWLIAMTIKRFGTVNLNKYRVCWSKWDAKTFRCWKTLFFYRFVSFPKWYRFVSCRCLIFNIFFVPFRFVSLTISFVSFRFWFFSFRFFRFVSSIVKCILKWTKNKIFHVFFKF